MARKPKPKNQDPSLVAELSAIEADLKALRSASKALLKRADALSRRLTKAEASDDAKYAKVDDAWLVVASYDDTLRELGRPDQDGVDVCSYLIDMSGLLDDAISRACMARAALPDETQRITALLAQRKNA